MKTRIPSAALVLASLVLVVLNVAVFTHLYQPQTANLTVSFLDVGQGDAILIEGPTGIEMLIDGGKDRSVLRELPRVMGPLDRSIDVVVATHPDADHIGGLPGVLSRYSVGWFFEPGKEGESSMYESLVVAVDRERGIEEGMLRNGMRIHLGGGAYADILHPEENVAQLRETNDASIMMRVVYGETEFMLTGDAPSWVEDRVVRRYGSIIQSDVLKAGHHGSKTSTSPAFLAAVDPGVVVVSAGKDNSYGHPHQDVVARILESGATLVSTITEGTITFVSDGKEVVQK
ncbi:MAG: Competence protein ComEC [Patescibacteria group bacterium]|nr:Competence protein ComEC [Patescibacteria group bacterium]